MFKPVALTVAALTAGITLTACGSSGSSVSGGLSDADKAICASIKALTVSGDPVADNPVAAEWNAAFSQAANVTDNPDLAKVGQDFALVTDMPSWDVGTPYRDRALKICGN